MKKHRDWKTFRDEVRVGDIVSLSCSEDDINERSYRNGNHNMYAFLLHKWGRIIWIDEDRECFTIKNVNVFDPHLFLIKIPFSIVNAATVFTSDLLDFSLLKDIYEAPVPGVLYAIGQYIQVTDRSSYIHEGKLIAVGTDHILLQSIDGDYNIIRNDSIVFISSNLMDDGSICETAGLNPIPISELNDSYIGKVLICYPGAIGILSKFDDNIVYIIDQKDGAESMTNRSFIDYFYVL